MNYTRQSHDFTAALWVLVVLSIVLISLFVFNPEGKTVAYEKASIPTIGTPVQNIILSARTNDITFGWVGDIAPNTGAENSIFEDVQYFLREPDVMMANFEGVITEEDEEAMRCEPNNTTCWIFNGDTNFVKLLDTSGIDVLSLANNHSRDYGDDGYDDTKEALSAFQTAGDAELVFARRNGFVIGFIGVYLHGRIGQDDIVKLVQQSEKTADITVVMMHGGAEGSQERYVTKKYETYKGANRGNMYMLAHTVINHGAELVVGSGPHVLRGIERYKNGVVAYSMGNFYGTRFATGGDLSKSGIFSVTFDEEKNVTKIQLVPVKINSKGVPSIDKDRESIPFINALSKKDFGDNAVLFDENGFAILES